MPIDTMMSDAMLGTFRKMVSDCREKNYSGEAFNTMCNIMDEMETLAKTMHDFTAFSAKLTTDGYFVNFSNAYSKVLSQAATTQYSSATYNDAALLQQTLKMYEDSLANTATDKEKLNITKILQDIIALGKSGINYPTFLRLLIEQGLDKALEGTIINRNYLAEDVAKAEAMQHPPTERRSKAILAKYDELAMATGIPNNIIFFSEQGKILDDAEADMRQYQHIQQLWWNMLTNLHTWIDAYTRFAFTDDRFAGNTVSETQENIDRSKNELPGKIKIYEQQLSANYGIKWLDIFATESFIAETKSNRFNYTEAYIEFIKTDIYPACVPLKPTDNNLIQQAEKLYGKALQ